MLHVRVVSPVALTGSLTGRLGFPARPPPETTVRYGRRPPRYG